MDETNDVLTFEERGGMTIWGEAISAQVRDHGQLALYIRDDAPRSTEDDHPAILPAGDVNKLRALLEEARQREDHGR